MSEELELGIFHKYQHILLAICDVVGVETVDEAFQAVEELKNTRPSHDKDEQIKQLQAENKRLAESQSHSDRFMVSYYSLEKQVTELKAQLDAQPDYGKVRELVEEIVKHEAGVSAHNGDSTCRSIPRQLAEQALSVLNSVKPESPWIIIEGNLPLLSDTNMNVGCLQSDWLWVTDGTKIEDAFYYDLTKREPKPNHMTGKGWRVRGMDPNKITHFMYKPKPPKSRDKGTGFVGGYIDDPLDPAAALDNVARHNPVSGCSLTLRSVGDALPANKPKTDLTDESKEVE